MASKKTRYFKYHKKSNVKEGLFEDGLFKKAQIVLLKVPPRGNAEVHFVVDQNKEENWQLVDHFELPDSFEVPGKAIEIDRAYFKALAG